MASEISTMRYRTGGEIPTSGIYLVRHKKHRLPHEVTLLRGETFPSCVKCDDAVEFELVRGVQLPPGSPFRVVLSRVPELEAPAQASTSEKKKAS